MGEACTQVLNRKVGVDQGSTYRQRSPKNTILFQVISEHFPKFISVVESTSDPTKLPDHVDAEFDAYLKCGLLEYCFDKMSCTDCKATTLVPLSCKKRGFSPSCIGKRMNEGSEFFVSQVIPRVPIRQWVLSFPMPARFWMARNPKLMGSLLNIFIRAVHGYYREMFLLSSGLKTKDFKVQTGTITVIQRFGGALNANIHFHTLCLDGVYVSKKSESIVPLFFPHHSEKTEDVEKHRPEFTGLGFTEYLHPVPVSEKKWCQQQSSNLFRVSYLK